MYEFTRQGALGRQMMHVNPRWKIVGPNFVGPHCVTDPPELNPRYTLGSMVKTFSNGDFTPQTSLPGINSSARLLSFRKRVCVPILKDIKIVRQ